MDFRGKDMRRSVGLLGMLMMFILVVAVTPLWAADSLSSVVIGDKMVELSAGDGIEQTRYFTLDSPKRLVVDLYGVTPGNEQREFSLMEGFQQLRVGPRAGKTRFVFDVAGAVFPTFNMDITDERVVVTWEPSQKTVTQAQAEPKTAGSAKITAIDFSSDQNRSQFDISVTGQAQATDPVQDGNRVQFTVNDTTLPRALRRVFDTLAFPSAIYSVTPYLVNAGGQPAVRFVVLLKGDVPYRLQKDATGFTFTVEDGRFGQAYPPTTGKTAQSADGVAFAGEGEITESPSMPAQPPSRVTTGGDLPVPVVEQVGAQPGQYTGEKTSLVFDNADVRDILRLIAEISDLNIIASDAVQGNVTLRLIDVPWDQSLALILDVTGLGMIQEGNVVRVLPKEQIRAMKEAELTAARSQEKLEPLTTEVVTVSYADLGSVSGPVQKVLSERGSLTEDSRNKLLIITDVQQRIDKAKSLIAILDTPERQVMLEARIVQVSSNYSRDLGVNWGVTYNDPNSEGLNSGSLVAGGLVTSALPALGTSGLGAGFTIGNSLTNTTILDLRLSALETDGKGKVISTPRVTTLNGETATISQGTSIPFQTSGADGPKTEFVDAELKLEVTPVINPDDSIILEILATNDSPSQTAGATAPSIDTKQAETKVLIRDGETTVLGGIFVENEQKSDEGIPGLKNIPIMGHLFKSQKTQTVKDELLIFITPRIVHNQ